VKLISSFIALTGVSMRILQIPIETLLNLAVCAEDFGFQEIYGDIASMTGWVSDEEINEFSEAILEEGSSYTQEDVESHKQRLTEWRNQYCHQ
jgi:hypothetical protein